MILIVALCATTMPLDAKNSLSRREKKDGWQLLFDGHSLGRLHTATRTGGWIVNKGHLTWDKGGAWLATDDTYYDFVIRLEYRASPGANSGVFLRSSADGDPAKTGMEFDLPTGTLGGVIQPSKNMARKSGEWNKVEITVQARRVSAVWNGERVIDADLDDHPALASRAAWGHAGLEAPASGPPVEFRNLRVRVLKIGPRFPPKKEESQ